MVALQKVDEMLVKKPENQSNMTEKKHLDIILLAKFGGKREFHGNVKD